MHSVIRSYPFHHRTVTPTVPHPKGNCPACLSLHSRRFRIQHGTSNDACRASPSSPEKLRGWKGGRRNARDGVTEEGYETFDHRTSVTFAILRNLQPHPLHPLRAFPADPARSSVRSTEQNSSTLLFARLSLVTEAKGDRGGRGGGWRIDRRGAWPQRAARLRKLSTRNSKIVFSVQRVRCLLEATTCPLLHPLSHSPLLGLQH